MIKFLDLHKINQRFENVFTSKFTTFLCSGRYINGQEVTAFEEAFSNYCGTKHCIGVANGLDALTLIFKAYIQLNKLKKGDEVLVPANTYIASILAVINSGLKPVFIEPNQSTFNIEATEIEKHLTPNTKVILVVHLYGQLANMEAVNAIAKNNNLIVIEDAAQAHGAIDTITNKRAGNLSDAAAFSFYPSKNLGALGDAGAVTTNNTKLSNCIRLLSNYGSSKKYENKIIGFNSRLDEIQATFLITKLNFLDDDNFARRIIANRYLSEIENSKIVLPFYDGSNNHVFHVFVVSVADRDDFVLYMDKMNIGYLIHYPVAPHKQEALTKYNHLRLPITEAIHQSLISLPISPVMTNEEVDYVISKLNSY